MRQRVPRRAWYSSEPVGHRPRVLVEDDHPALAISDFSSFAEAGFDVAVCSGPGRSGQSCPLLCGQECGLVARADAVLHGLDPGLGIAAAIRQRHPDLAVLVEPGARESGDDARVPEGCVRLVFGCSVHGQIEALRHVVAASSHG
jgi:hypothetical protein